MPQPQVDPIFEFDSGGPDGWGPFGRWTVTLDAAGTLVLRHTGSGQIREWGSVALPAAEVAALWHLVDAVDIAHLASSTRRPVPDEGAYTLSLREEKERPSACVWRHDALKDPRIAALVEGLARVISQVTGEAPVLR